VFYCTACGAENPENRQACSVCNTPRARYVSPQAVRSDLRSDPGAQTVVGEQAQLDRAYPNAPLYQPPQTTVCPRCHRATYFLQQEKVSTGGIIVFAILILLCAPLCWIGLLIKDKYLVCSSCGMLLRSS
jgi:hypothetical protein